MHRDMVAKIGAGLDPSRRPRPCRRCVFAARVPRGQGRRLSSGADAFTSFLPFLESMAQRDGRHRMAFS
jgi:hypothetical protein